VRRIRIQNINRTVKLISKQNDLKVSYQGNEKRSDSIYSKRIKAGKRRTYFFDVRTTRANDYYLTITESRKKFDQEGYERHKIFLYKEDFNKFIQTLEDIVSHVKTELMPDFDFDSYNHDEENHSDRRTNGVENTDNKSENGFSSNGYDHGDAGDKW
jgi:hypothetical protein